MPEHSLSPEPALPDIATHQDPTSSCLRVHTIQLKIFANYECCLEEMVLKQPVKHLDAKLFKKHRRILRTIEAYKILVFLWKESEFVSDEVLAQIGLRRSYDGKELTAHHLASDLAETGGQVAALNSRIRNIGIAASSFDLIDRESLNSTKVLLKGTAFLHQFMTGLASQNLLLLNELAAELIAPVPSTNDSQER